ncbi:MAG: nitroreductase family protein [Elusimicrobiota bacterium]
MCETMTANDFWEVVKRRRSVRDFLPEPVPRVDIEKILEAAILAPSGGNKQNWHFIVVSSEQTKSQMRQIIVDKIQELTKRMKSVKAKKEFSEYSLNYFTFFSKAPVVIAVVKKPYDSTTQRILKLYKLEEEYRTTAGLQGVAAAIENMLLAAETLGYGSCWMTGPTIAHKELEKFLKIDSADELVALVPLGKAKTKPPMPQRKKLAEVVSFL